MILIKTIKVIIKKLIEIVTETNRMLWFSRRKRRKIVASRIIEEMARCEKGMKIGRDESEYIYVYIYMCVYVYVRAGGRVPKVREGWSAILQRKPLAPGQGRVSLRIGIRCSTPGY